MFNDRSRSMWTTLKQQLWRWRGVLIIAPIIVGGLLMLRLAGALQFMELEALDQMFRLRPAEPADSRIVLVTVDESDIRQLGQWPMSDAVLARLISSIKQQQPRVIGLDIFRDFPVEPGHSDLINVFTSTPNLIGVEKVIRTPQGEVIQPPPNLAQRGQISASDLLLDTDGRIRRSLLFLTTKDGKLIPTLGSQLAFEYLKAEGIQLKSIDASKGQFQLGRAVFRTLEPNDGGYVSVDAGGYQILSNFPNFPRGFCTISMTEMLQGHIPKSLMRASGEAPLRDRIVLIGVTAESVEDRFFTSTTTDSVAAPAGVEVHALLTSQLLSAALDGRPFLNVWSDPVEWLWVILWGTIGAVIGWRSPSPQQMVVKTLLLTIVLLGSAYVLFLMGWWVIIIPPLFALMGSAITSNGYRLWENLKGYTRRLEQRVQERTLILQQEIAERKRVESSLAESEARFRLLAEATIEGIAIIEQGKILDVNEAFIQMFGYSASAITKMPPSDIVTPDYRELVVHNIQSHYDGFYEVVCLRSDGTTFPAEFHAKVMSDGDRVIRITSIRDISDRKRAEAAAVLEERNRMAREIHDTLAQAFTGILLQVGGAIKLITKNPDLVQSHLQTAKELARTGLTEARRSVAALRPKVLEEGDLPSALKQLITQMQSSTDAHFTCEISGEAKVLSPYIEDNLFRIGQEALTNAIKYADASEIEVELVYEETQFLFRVKDNGRGFDIDQISPGINGFGLLGMSERVERIGGELIIQSHPGEGTEVVVIVNRE